MSNERRSMSDERRAVSYDRPGSIWLIGSLLTRYLLATSECVIACTERAIRFCTPTLRINFAT